MPLESPKAELTHTWLAKARRDLEAAARTGMAPSLPDVAAFHCQQVTEKALKGFLVWHDQPFRKTHNRTELGRQCVGIDPTLEEVVSRAARLTEYAWRFRYPGEPAEPSASEADEALVLAKEVYTAILSRLPREVGP